MSARLELGHIDYLDVNNFKSYKGQHRVGPFKNFTAIVGPNGAGTARSIFRRGGRWKKEGL